jgi:hypothetical protein
MGVSKGTRVKSTNISHHSITMDIKKRNENLAPFTGYQKQ